MRRRNVGVSTDGEMQMASYTFEVEVECEGRVTRADESVGYAGNEIEDADLSSVSMLKPRRVLSGYKLVWDNIDLLEGLDPVARNIVIANIMAAFSTEIDEAILSDA